MPLPAEAMPRAPQIAGPPEAKTPGGSGRLGSGPSSKMKQRLRRARELAPLGFRASRRRELGVRRWPAEVEVVSSRRDADPTANLRHRTRASICPRPLGCPLRPGAVRLAPPRPRPCCGRRCRVGRGGGPHSGGVRLWLSTPGTRWKLARAPPLSDACGAGPYSLPFARCSRRAIPLPGFRAQNQKEPPRPPPAARGNSLMLPSPWPRGLQGRLASHPHPRHHVGFRFLASWVGPLLEGFSWGILGFLGCSL